MTDLDWKGLTVYTEPAAEPVSLTEAKAHCRVDISDDDTLITSLITVAREVVEAIARRALVTQTLELTADEFPEGDTITVPRPPLQSVTSIKYTDEDETESTFSSDYYIVDTDSEPGRIVLKSDYSWPSDTLQAANGVRTRFVAGFGGAADVPQKYKQAVLLLVGHYYENREMAISTGAVPKEIPMGVAALLWLDRNMGFP